MAKQKDRARAVVVGILLVAAVLGGCSSTARSSKDAGDAASSDSNPMCTYADGGAPGDSGVSGNTCPTAVCPSGFVCVLEVGGPAESGGSHCAPIPTQCHGTPTCECMATCVCIHPFGSQAEMCTAQNGSIYCDNGIR